MHVGFRVSALIGILSGSFIFYLTMDFQVMELAPGVSMGAGSEVVTELLSGSGKGLESVSKIQQKS